MSKESIVGLEKAFASKGKVLDPYKQIYQINEEEFELQNKMNDLGNKVWKLKNERLKISHEIKTLEDNKVKIFTALGKKYVEVVKDD